MKKMRKAIATVACAALLVVGSVAATMAYLTDKDTVTNTFTAGEVEISLDESKVDLYGVANTSVPRVKENASYVLIPGHVYTKDPVIHFAPKSEASWLFVKLDIDPEIKAVEDASSTLADQLSTNGWTQLTGAGTDLVYYQEVLKNDTPDPKDYKVFETFTVSADAIASQIDACKDKRIIVTAYAVQKEGVANATDAWNIVKTL